MKLEYSTGFDLQKRFHEVQLIIYESLVSDKDDATNQCRKDELK